MKDVEVPVDVQDKDGVTPLMSAADYACDAAVKELLALGANHAVVKSDGTMAARGTQNRTHNASVFTHNPPFPRLALQGFAC